MAGNRIGLFAGGNGEHSGCGCDRERIRAEALYCELVRGVKPLFGSKIYYRTIGYV